jgi:hypothetical protein
VGVRGKLVGPCRNFLHAPRASATDRKPYDPLCRLRRPPESLRSEPEELSRIRCHLA